MSTPIVRRRKKPVPVVTMQWLGDNVGDLVAFTGGSFFRAEPGDFLDPDITGKVYDYLHSTWVGVKTQQHVVRGVVGEYYPIDDGEVLDQSYDECPPAGAFFEPGRTYRTDDSGDRLCPWIFEVRFTDTEPDTGRLIAFGYLHSGTGLGIGHTEYEASWKRGWTDITPAGDR